MLCRRGKRCGPFPFPMWFFLVTFYHLLKKPRYNFCRRILGQTADEISETQCLCGFPALSYYNAFVNPPNNSCGFHTIPPVAVSHRKLSGGLFFHRIVFARFDGIIRKECPRLEEMCFLPPGSLTAPGCSANRSGFGSSIPHSPGVCAKGAASFMERLILRRPPSASPQAHKHTPRSVFGKSPPKGCFAGS